jgi:hypothetical protein
MIRLGRTALLALLLVTVAGCGQAPAPAAAPTPVPPTTVAPIPTPGSAALPAEPVAPTSWVMPDLVGENLQDAQNAVQALTDFGIAITTSRDATGQGRSQVLDANWRVCDQNIAPGEEITPTSDIEFGAVKLDEDC